MKQVLYLLCICAIGCSDSEIQTDQNGTTLCIEAQDPELYVVSDRLRYRGNLYTGIVYALLPGKKDTLMQAQYLNGMLDGVSKKYYAGGMLKEYREYLHGMKHGMQEAYWENGKNRFRYQARADVCEGTMLEWDKDGKLVHLANYRSGKEQGVQRMWYNNGLLKANYVVWNGRRYGLPGTKNCRNVSDSLVLYR